MVVEKNKIKKISDEELKEASGGFAGPNKYTKSEYHDAGFITSFSLIQADMCGLCAGPGLLIYGDWHNCRDIDKFVDYYRTHTIEEYEDYIRNNYFGGYSAYKYQRGYDD